MPNAALAAAERQFLRLLERANPGLNIEVKLYRLGGVPQDAGTDCWRYFAASEIWDSDHDALIVTGTEPRAPDLEDESYWPMLTAVIDWACTHVHSAIWSCLAAHSAVRHLDGIRRRPLERKCFGVFPVNSTIDHPLLEGVSFPAWVQHSRWNGLDSVELQAAGYTILTQSFAVGVDMFLSETKPLFLFLQGHPEYEADTLIREYRRDIARFLRYERDVCPLPPENCLNEKSRAAIIAFRDRAIKNRHPALLEELPIPQEMLRVNRAEASAVCIYRNWLSIVSDLKMERPTKRGQMLSHGFTAHR